MRDTRIVGGNRGFKTCLQRNNSEEPRFIASKNKSTAASAVTAIRCPEVAADWVQLQQVLMNPPLAEFRPRSTGIACATGISYIGPAPDGPPY